MFSLLFGASILIEESKVLAESLGVSKLIIGVTVVAFGTSLPELVVSLSSISLPDYSHIVIGNIVGSNIANIGLVLGVILLIKPMIVLQENKIYFNILIMITSTLLFSFYLINRQLNAIEGFTLILCLTLYLFILFKNFSRTKMGNINSSISFNTGNLFLLISGFIIVAIGSDLFLLSAQEIALSLNLNMLVFSVVLIALATSLPELITSIVAIYKNESGLSLGNIIGSNIINILLVGGLSATISEININFDISMDIMIMLTLALLLMLVQFFCKKAGRWLGLIYLLIYIYFIVQIL